MPIVGTSAMVIGHMPDLIKECGLNFPNACQYLRTRCFSFACTSADSPISSICMQSDEDTHYTDSSPLLKCRCSRKFMCVHTDPGKTDLLHGQHDHTSQGVKSFELEHKINSYLIEMPSFLQVNSLLISAPKSTVHARPMTMLPETMS